MIWPSGIMFKKNIKITTIDELQLFEKTISSSQQLLVNNRYCPHNDLNRLVKYLLYMEGSCYVSTSIGHKKKRKHNFCTLT